MSGSRQQSQACAACRHQRRKCYPDCVMARHFPADQSQQFLDVHRLFGVSNVMKTYNSVAPEHRNEAMESMKYEAEMWRGDPVHGCLGVVRNLSAQIEEAKRELEATQQQIQFHKKQEHVLQIVQAAQQQQMLLLQPPLQQPQFGGPTLQLPSSPLPDMVNPTQRNGENQVSDHLPSLETEDVVKPLNDAHLDVQTDKSHCSKEDLSNSEDPTMSDKEVEAKGTECKESSEDEM